MSKNFFKDGKWIDNPNTPAVVACKCGNKYIKTRNAQTTCISCLVRVK